MHDHHRTHPELPGGKRRLTDLIIGHHPGEGEDSVKKTTITVDFKTNSWCSRVEDHPAYQVAGHLHVCRSPLEPRFWVVVHQPSGLPFNEAAGGSMPFITRRRAAATATSFGRLYPAVTSEEDLADLLKRDEDNAWASWRRACMMHLGE